MTPPSRGSVAVIAGAVFTGAVFAVACGAAVPRGSEAARLEAKEAVGAVLDDWHAAAAASDEDRYFDHLAEDAVFLGTDATERWTKAAFRAYAHPHFEAGDGWAFRATRRDVVLDRGRALAWFDEDLATEGLGPARGSGVLRRGDDGRWRIVQYNLAITVPNERFGEVRALLAGDAAPTIEGTPIVDTPENRAAIAAVERYRAAMIARDADALAALISPRYSDDAGTPAPDDDLDAESLRYGLGQLLGSTDEVSLTLEYRAVTREGGRVHVDVLQDASYRVGDDVHTSRGENRFTLERDAGGLRFVAGL